MKRVFFYTALLSSVVDVCYQEQKPMFVLDEHLPWVRWCFKESKQKYGCGGLCLNQIGGAFTRSGNLPIWSRFCQLSSLSSNNSLGRGRLKSLCFFFCCLLQSVSGLVLASLKIELRPSTSMHEDGDGVGQRTACSGLENGLGLVRVDMGGNLSPAPLFRISNNECHVGAIQPLAHGYQVKSSESKTTRC